MKTFITLDKYLRMGGLLENVEWIYADQTFGDENLGNRIVSCQDMGERNSSGDKLLNFTFANGKTKRYAISWIELNVDLILNEKYTVKL